MIRAKLALIGAELSRYWLILAIMVLFFVASSLLTGTGCVFYSTIGLPCPGCGGTRALWALLRGDWTGAFHMHPFIFVVPAPVLMGVALFLTREKMPLWWDIVLWVMFALLLVTYAVRMAVLFPHTEPMTVNENAWLPRLWRLLYLRV